MWSGNVLLGETGVEIACSFVGGKQKQLVFQDWEPEACGVFALLVFYTDGQCAIGAAVGLVGVQAGLVVLEEQAAVDVICAGFGYENQTFLLLRGS